MTPETKTAANQPLALRSDETTLAAAQANTLASSTWMVDHLNAELISRYNSKFDSWKTMVLAGKIPNTDPPMPPQGFVVHKSAAGFSFPDISEFSIYVCPPRTDIPADHSKTQAQIDAETGPGSIRIGVHLYGNYWQALQGDTCPDGFKTPPLPPGIDFPPGTIFQKVMSPFGGWWLKIN